MNGLRHHPCPFPDEIVNAARSLLPVDRYPRIVDPFAGIGRVHKLPNETVGIELEPEWAEWHPSTVVGDAREIPYPDGHFDGAFTSPCYGNRMADSYTGENDTCVICAGEGRERIKAPETTEGHVVGLVECRHCGGSGRKPSRRRTYRISLGRSLSDGNAGAMQWGPEYRRLHAAAWRELARVVRADGRFVLNVKNHIRGGTVRPVAEWHLDTLVGSLNWRLDRIVPVAATGWKVGANADLREDHEFVFALRRTDR